MLELPDDVLYLVFAHLDTAKDLRALSLTNKRFHTVINGDNNEGWRVFVRTRFPSLYLTSLPTSSFKWPQLAKSLTWQSRAWDRRSLSFQAMLPTPPRAPRRGPATGRRPHQAPFHPVVDAHSNLATNEELVVWGAGETIVARRRSGRKADWTPKQTVWHRVEGAEMGYSAGYDDVTALSIVEGARGKPGKLGMVVGRDNGHLALLGAGNDDFGQRLADFHPRHTEEADAGWFQEKINSVDVIHQQGCMAVATKAAVLLYSLPQDDADMDVAPSAYLSFATQASDDSWESVGGAKWMGKDTLALGMSGRKDPLRYVKVSPTGFEDVVPVRNDALEAKFSIEPNKSSLCTSSLTPIDATSITGGHGSNLLLSSWRDGSIRLQDIRTPSSLDLVYSDNIDPWSALDTLLPFGTSHFVGGGPHGATIKVFDFRWPRQYFHTAALPCGKEQPVPTPSQPFLSAPTDHKTRNFSCDHIAGYKCRWHALSQDIYHRPNGTFFFSKSLPRATAYACVWSMARASPLSPNFYIGLSGGVVEANLATLPPISSTHETEVDPHFGWVPSVQRDMGESSYEVHELDASLMETGDGQLYPENLRSVRMPAMRGKGWSRISEKMGNGVPERLVRRHRLDERFHVLPDFDRADLLGLMEEESKDEQRTWFEDGDVDEIEA
ncbi:hypothetical protein N0V93_002194 [Gnomoniopsis smithogilvyi]|uniref:F-box domain-containing protein n=1 Tax=Gnomoniopsis smithogilvyi TaxID=1191159 RepID=A0A9W8YYA4_9PEZI|nr:hypothetical protein N0V93_002194 [Gnomoniopsis smithogilvyi]